MELGEYEKFLTFQIFKLNLVLVYLSRRSCIRRPWCDTAGVVVVAGAVVTAGTAARAAAVGASAAVGGLAGLSVGPRAVVGVGSSRGARGVGVARCALGGWRRGGAA